MYAVLSLDLDKVTTTQRDKFYESLKNKGKLKVLQEIICYDTAVLDVNYSIGLNNFKKSTNPKKQIK